MKINNFFAELKRRNVYKVAVAYAVVAWLTIQAASIFLPAFNAPQWAMQIVILILVLGFPIALAFAWAFEITPEGIVKTEEMPAENSARWKATRRLDFVIIGILALAIAFLLLFRSNPSHKTRSLVGVPDKGIAVLPFENFSDDRAN